MILLRSIDFDASPLPHALDVHVLGTAAWCVVSGGESSYGLCDVRRATHSSFSLNQGSVSPCAASGLRNTVFLVFKGDPRISASTVQAQSLDVLYTELGGVMLHSPVQDSYGSQAGKPRPCPPAARPLIAPRRSWPPQRPAPHPVSRPCGRPSRQHPQARRCWGKRDRRAVEWARPGRSLIQ
jgi:hypothetical protein